MKRIEVDGGGAAKGGHSDRAGGSTPASARYLALRGGTTDRKLRLGDRGPAPEKSKLHTGRMHGRLRVLFVHHRPEAGGAPKSLALIIPQLREEVEAFVLCPSGPAAQQFREAGAEVLTAPVATFTHIWASVYRGPRWALLGIELSRLPSHLLSFRDALIKTRPQLVHLNDAPLVPAAEYAARAAVPVIWHLRSALPAEDTLRGRWLRGRIHRLATQAVGINEDVANSYALTRPPAVIFDPVAMPELGSPGSKSDGEKSDAKGRLGLDPHSPAVGMLSNLYAAKGWQDLVNAGSLLKMSGIKHQIALVGSPVRTGHWHRSTRGRLLARLGSLEDTENDLLQMIAQLGLEESVRLVPFRAAVDDVYRALDVVCFPSRGPEVGRPVIEGQAYGLPVVTSGSRDGGGLIRDRQTGFLVPQKDPHALAGTLGELLEDADLRRRVGRNARAHAESQYALPHVAARVYELYSQVLSPIRNPDVPSPRLPGSGSALRT